MNIDFTPAGLAFVVGISDDVRAGSTITVDTLSGEKSVQIDLVSTRDGVRVGFLSARASAPLYRAAQRTLVASSYQSPAEYIGSTQYEEDMAESRYARAYGYED